MIEDLPYERFRLANGLKVVLHRDASLPLVAVNLWYAVGSKDEPSGRSGFAHLFEHLMFMGTERAPESDFDRLMEAEGGSNNASTSRDRTNYYEGGPRSLLPTLLWLEADRMEGLGLAMTQEKLDLQRNVVRNERRESYENRPYGRAWLELPRLMYPEVHPYHHPVIGSHEDLEAASLEDVKDFFATWYTPDNASLVVAGDFEIEPTRRLVEELFGSIPAGTGVVRRSADLAPLRHGRRAILHDRVPAPQLLLAWHAPAAFAEGDADLDLCGEVLAGGPSSRLDRLLVQERRLVQSVSAWQDSGELGSRFMISATALPGASLEEIEDLIRKELVRLASEGPTAEEVRREVTKEEASVLREIQGLSDRADRMNLYRDVFDDPGALGRDLARYAAVTPRSMASHARVFLEEPTAILCVPRPERSALEPSPRDVRPEAAPGRRWTAPEPEAFRLANGVEVWLVERHAIPLVAMQLCIPGGAGLDPAGKEGLGSLLAEMMTEGAGSRDVAALAAALDALGTDLSVEASRESVFLSLSALRRNLDASLDLAMDVLGRPRFDHDDFERVRSLRLAALEQALTRPDAVARHVANAQLWQPGTSWSAPVGGRLTSVAELAHDDLARAHRTLLAAPANARLVVVGDLDAGQVRAALESRLGFWTPDPGNARAARAPDPVRRAGLKVFVVDRPRAPQTVIRFQRPGVPLDDPASAGLNLANVILGGSFTSRLNQNLRERNGFTYGAWSVLHQGRRVGTVAATSSVRTEVTGAALREFRHEFDRLAAADFSAQELGKALATARNEMIAPFQGVGDTADAFAAFAAAGLPATALTRYVEALERATLGEVSELATEHFDFSRGVLVLVGDADRVLPQLADSGFADRPVTLCDAEGAPLGD